MTDIMVDGSETRDTDRVSSLYKDAVEAHIGGQFDDAIRMVTEALMLDADNLDLVSQRSECFLKKRQYVFALRDSNRCIEQGREKSIGYYLKGQAYEQLLQYASALNAYNDGLRVDSTNEQLLKARDIVSGLDDVLQYTQTVDPTDLFTILLKWLKQYGAKFPKLHLKKYTDSYRGVHALGDIHNDEMVLYVPHRLIMTSELARASPIGVKVTQSNVELRSKHTYLALYLLEERLKGDGSFWAPYIRTLPANFDNMPTHFSETDLEMLNGSFTLPKIADRQESLFADYTALCRCIPEVRKYTFQDFVWGRLVVITRIFGLQISGVKTDGLVPLADMLNHQLPRDTKWSYDDPTSGFVISSLTCISRGLPVFDSYGRKCNSRFFVNYGFVLEDNTDNEALFQLEIPQDALYTAKLRCIGVSSLISARREYQTNADYHDGKCREMQSFARFIALDAMDLTSLAIDPHNINRISMANEMKAMDVLREAALRSLTKFPTTLAEDKDILASEKYEMYSNQRNCVVMRMGEKIVLYKVIELVELAQSLLGNIDSVPQWLQENGNHPFHMYVGNVLLNLHNTARKA